MLPSGHENTNLMTYVLFLHAIAAVMHLVWPCICNKQQSATSNQPGVFGSQQIAWNFHKYCLNLCLFGASQVSEDVNQTYSHQVLCLMCCCARILNCSLYLRLQRIYHDQAVKGAAAVEAHVRQILAGLGRSTDGISHEAVRHLSKNARNIRVLR